MILNPSFINNVLMIYFIQNVSSKRMEYLTFKLPKIIFSLDKEKDCCLSFLDINIFRGNGKSTTVQRKKTCNGVYVNFKSFITETCKICSVDSLFYYFYYYFKFHHKFDTLPCVLHKNSYLDDLVNKCIKKFLRKIWQQKL